MKVTFSEVRQVIILLWKIMKTKSFSFGITWNDEPFTISAGMSVNWVKFDVMLMFTWLQSSVFRPVRFHYIISWMTLKLINPPSLSSSLHLKTETPQTPTAICVTHTPARFPSALIRPHTHLQCMCMWPFPGPSLVLFKQHPLISPEGQSTQSQLNSMLNTMVLPWLRATISSLTAQIKPSNYVWKHA